MRSEETRKLVVKGFIGRAYVLARWGAGFLSFLGVCSMLEVLGRFV